ncbi:diphosphomevalonate decarboxylase [Prolixibacter sp. NT017]|uniref:diphosphomevalonate decarboxylase n=1 Tax=Prolixibacter sp. NT017 TaxID=2652390 RepID=UPI00127F8F79|nr:diphosphomevalonate decarboxylase [Prolixibacter sp. NT017]GET24732.1 diphosphomevalonate decarboxylase [Prolixibacter sp. NT017]
MADKKSDWKETTWVSPSNIALIKYWGKHGEQLPNNPSLSLTLKNSVTKTKLRYRRLDEPVPDSEDLKVAYWFDGERNEAFERKVANYLRRLLPEMPYLTSLELEFQSTNTFPHSTGIASSASSMSAITLCLVDMEKKMGLRKPPTQDLSRRASHLARLGSGSACRSVYGGWVTWGEDGLLPDSSDRYASPLEQDIPEQWQNLRDAILIVNSDRKKVSSSAGHGLMSNHPFAEGRYRQARKHLNCMMLALQNGDEKTFVEVVESEALSLHGLLMTSSQDGLLLQPESLQIINAVRAFREKTGLMVCFTLDAGPNVHLLYRDEDKEMVQQFIQEELLPFCENRQWIDDEIGEGPYKEEIK